MISSRSRNLATRPLAICVSIAAIALPQGALAGAWTLGEGFGQVLVTGTASEATQAFDSTRDRQGAPTYSKQELQALIEYGATDWLTLMVQPSLQHIAIAPPIDATRGGLGYTEFGARARLMQSGPWVASVQTTFRMPATTDSSNPAAIGYNDVEADVRGLVGYSFSLDGHPAFVDLQAAQRFRGNGLPSEFRFDATLGIRLAPQWLLLLQSLNTVSEGGGSLVTSYDYEKLQLSFVYDVSARWSLQAGAFVTYSGRNALQENGGLLGAWYRF